MFNLVKLRHIPQFLHVWKCTPDFNLLLSFFPY